MQPNKHTSLLTIALLAFTLTGFAQKKHYVKPGGTLSGLSWDWASGNLQATLDKAVAGDIIYVATGTYSGGFVMKEGVTVLGGYTANPNNPTERYLLMETDDPAKQSILDGGGSQRVITQLAPFSTPTVWEGFVIQNGNPSVTFEKGSVIYSKNGENKIIGVLYKLDETSGEGMIIGREEIRKSWGGYGTELSGLPLAYTSESAQGDQTGQANTATIVTGLANQSVDFSAENYPLNGNYAAFWCDTLTAGGYNDWYLPSAGELQEIKDAGVLSVMKSIGKEVLHGCWTSSQAGNTLAWAYYFGKGHCHPALKYVQHNVSAIHPFTAPEQAEGIYVAGGGAFLNNNGLLENCIVKNNTSSYRGGGVYVGAGGQLINCVVEGNEAPEGKEIYYESTVNIPAVDHSGLNVYPNPVKAGEPVYVERNSADLHYRWLTISGVTVQKGTLATGENSLSTPLQKGIYLLQIQSDNKNYNLKIQIQ